MQKIIGKKLFSVKSNLNNSHKLQLKILKTNWKKELPKLKSLKKWFKLQIKLQTLKILTYKDWTNGSKESNRGNQVQVAAYKIKLIHLHLGSNKTKVHEVIA